MEHVVQIAYTFYSVIIPNWMEQCASMRQCHTDITDGIAPLSEVICLLRPSAIKIVDGHTVTKQDFVRVCNSWIERNLVRLSLEYIKKHPKICKTTISQGVWTQGVGLFAALDKIPLNATSPTQTLAIQLLDIIDHHTDSEERITMYGSMLEQCGPQTLRSLLSFRGDLMVENMSMRVLCGHLAMNSNVESVGVAIMHIVSASVRPKDTFVLMLENTYCRAGWCSTKATEAIGHVRATVHFSESEWVEIFGSWPFSKLPDAVSMDLLTTVRPRLCHFVDAQTTGIVALANICTVLRGYQRFRIQAISDAVDLPPDRSRWFEDNPKFREMTEENQHKMRTVVLQCRLLAREMALEQSLTMIREEITDNAVRVKDILSFAWD